VPPEVYEDLLAAVQIRQDKSLYYKGELMHPCNALSATPKGKRVDVDVLHHHTFSSLLPALLSC